LAVPPDQKAVRGVNVKNAPRRFYEFDEFRIDLEERVLTRAGEPLPLTPKVFDILLTLVENNGHTVEKDRLMESVWADSYVEDGNLNRNVSTLRKVLGEDSHEPRFIKTVPKRGYRFEGDVHEIVEEDEEIVVERRTKYSLALGQEIDTTSALRPASRFTIATALIGAVLIAIFAWAAFRSPAGGSDSFAVRSAGISKNEQAQELYLKSRALWQNRTAEGLHQATEYLEQAVRLDPQFALAHAALADAYAFDVGLWRKAEAAANEAIRIDPMLGEPHATVGFVRMFWEWRIGEAEAHFRRAISLNPDYATAHQWYALNLMARHRVGSALAEINRALELDPASLAINADLCQILYLSRKYDQAAEQCRKTLTMDSRFLTAHRLLYEIHSAKERFPEAVDEYFAAEDLTMTTAMTPGQLDRLRKAFTRGGIDEFWREKLRGSGNMAASEAARYHLRLGDRDEALKALEKAAEHREFDFIFFPADPLFAQLADDPRYGALAERLR
jgi:DNA-binding winged helix-turn-helix (wHTH) protein/Tfp pilus assembly protein PilF